MRLSIPGTRCGFSIFLLKGRNINIKRALYRAIVMNLEAFGVKPNDVKIILSKCFRLKWACTAV